MCCRGALIGAWASMGLGWAFAWFSPGVSSVVGGLGLASLLLCLCTSIVHGSQLAVRLPSEGLRPFGRLSLMGLGVICAATVAETFLQSPKAQLTLMGASGVLAPDAADTLGHGLRRIAGVCVVAFFVSGIVFFRRLRTLLRDKKNHVMNVVRAALDPSAEGGMGSVDSNPLLLCEPTWIRRVYVGATLGCLAALGILLVYLVFSGLFLLVRTEYLPASWRMSVPLARSLLIGPLALLSLGLWMTTATPPGVSVVVLGRGVGLACRAGILGTWLVPCLGWLCSYGSVGVPHLAWLVWASVVSCAQVLGFIHVGRLCRYAGVRTLAVLGYIGAGFAGLNWVFGLLRYLEIIPSGKSGAVLSGPGSVAVRVIGGCAFPIEVVLGAVILLMCWRLYRRAGRMTHVGGEAGL